MSRFRSFLIGLRALVLIPFITAFYGLCAIVVCAFDPLGKLANRRLARPWGREMLRAAGVRMRVEGLENLAGSEGPFIVAFNHSSHLDIPAIYAALPLQIRFVAKAELMRVPILGLAMKRLGSIVIDRSNRAQAIAGLKQAERMMREHRLSVVMAPEGTRSSGRELLPFKKGAFVLAVDTHIPVLPVTLVGAAEALPRGRWMPRGGELRVVVGAPVSTEGMTYADRERLMTAVRGEMEKNLRA